MKNAGKVSTDELAEHPGRYLMSTRSGFGLTKVFNKVSAEKVELVWSHWSGYWKREGCARCASGPRSTAARSSSSIVRMENQRC
jgi:hypothetical protein